MKLSGATFIRNAVIYHYPVVASVKSILPLCDELIINLGKSDDHTEELIRQIKSEKIKIIESSWDLSLRKHGLVLSQQSNLAIDNCTGDWIFYLQADEVVHENDYEKIYQAVKTAENDRRVDALVFDFIHFYGSAFTYQNARNWYKQEVRIIRNNKQIRSFGDAQGFRYLNGDKPRARHTSAKIYHYGWARPPAVMKTKTIDFNRLWHEDENYIEQLKRKKIEEMYADLDTLQIFTGTHPKSIYEDPELMNLENFLFILQLKEKVLQRLSLGQKIKSLVRRLPIGQYKGFKLVK